MALFFYIVVKCAQNGCTFFCHVPIIAGHLKYLVHTDHSVHTDLVKIPEYMLNRYPQCLHTVTIWNLNDVE